MSKFIKELKKLNHAWCCSKDKCTCESIQKDTDDLGNKIIQEIWNKEKKHRNSKNKKDGNI